MPARHRKNYGYLLPSPALDYAIATGVYGGVLMPSCLPSRASLPSEQPAQPVRAVDLIECSLFIIISFVVL